MEVILALITFILSIGGAICVTVVPLAIFIALGIFIYRRSKMRDAAKQSAQSWPGTMGVVSMSTIQIRRSANNSRSEVPVVGYQYQVDGQSYTGGTIKAGEQYFSVRLYGDARKTVERYPVGAQVMVYYNPANPSESALER
jgi:hypothetical protein